MQQAELHDPRTPTIDALKQLVSSDMEKVNARILSAIDNDVPLIQQIAQHIIVSGGKRLRPALTIACAKLLDYQGDRHVDLATSIEFIHTATLLHDDVVDKSELRRGEATANEVWGNKASVLVGDFLLSRAFQLMVQDGSLDVLSILSNASAIIAQGEVRQLIVAGDIETSETEYMQVISDKTAALFAAACELGGIVNDADEAQRAALRTFGLELGIAFQLVDDALDYVADEEAMGKAVGDDFRDRKITLPIIAAYAEGSDAERAFWREAMDEDTPQAPADLETALGYIKEHQTIGFTLTKARDAAEKARKALYLFPENQVRAILDETIDFCIERAY